MTKNVNITIDIKIARMMLSVAGFGLEEIKHSTDEEIFAKVLSLIECYGATSEIME
ncbi:MAG: hypothetical protein IJZ42_01755 [Lachnospiraceae bacterium]|nr:hypothetical protein [Lachnospiraceae bacterium]